MTEFAKIIKEKYAHMEEKPLYTKLNDLTFEEVRFITDQNYSTVKSAENAVAEYTSATKIKYKINGKDVEIYTGIYDGHIYVFDIYESSYTHRKLICVSKLNMLRRCNDIEILDVV